MGWRSELRQKGYQAPIIILTARTDEIDRVLGLEIGADDYMTKPFSIEELLLKIDIFLRRTKYAAVGSNVNLTGRIESFTTGGQILISEHTRQKIQAPLRLDSQFTIEPKGVSASLRLFEVGALGAPFDLSLPPKSASLRALASPVPIRFTALEEKFVGRTIYEGTLVEASSTGGRLHSGAALAAE